MKNAEFNAMDHDLAMQKNAEQGKWIPTIVQAEHAYSLLAGAPDALQLDPGFPPMGPQPDVSGEGQVGK